MAQPHPPRPVTETDRARWLVLQKVAADLANSGIYSEASTSLKSVVAEVEAALGMESEELVNPLRLLAESHKRAGLLDDAYNVMMRAMVLCEKRHGEEGLMTCQLRTVMGESRLVSTWKRSFSRPLSQPSPLPLCSDCPC